MRRFIQFAIQSSIAHDERGINAVSWSDLKFIIRR